MNPIIALWCHPRSMSTAVERVMRERGDCRCFHEPFLYDYYVHRAVRRFPHFEVDPATPIAYAEIRAMLLEAAEASPVFFKDMSYYVVPGLFEDAAFARRLTHTFLIRDPMRSILSYHKLDPAVTKEEIGLEAQWRHARWLVETLDVSPLVVEAEAVQRDPRAAIGAYWEGVGLPYAAQAFQWETTETPEDWQQVSGWHETVSGSSGIRRAASEDEAARRQAFEDAARAAPHLRDYLAHHLPYYEKLRRLARRPSRPPG